jgi:hypothetical protein
MAFDGGHGQLVMFGGTTTSVGGALSAGALNETWTWDGCNWTKQPLQLNPPSKRIDAGMAYDAARGKVVLFGGTDQNGLPLNDTWTWDGATWTKQTPVPSPPTAVGASLAYDSATSTVVLFEVPFGQKGNPPASQTWTWNGSTWSQPTVTTPPPFRYYPGMTYDQARGVVVLFGGQQVSKGGAITYLNDTWTWNGSNWQSPTSPPPALTGRALMGMDYDAALGVTVMTMGITSSGTLSPDTWYWNGTSWTQQNPAPVSPIRQAFVMTYFPPSGTVVLYGGSGPTGSLLQDTWIY